ncbi:acyl-CoA dehydrogenase [Arthrobacter sp. S13_S34]|nr:acyl-CoA dehydrogenase [Arthrobacter sp. S13_S34]
MPAKTQSTHTPEAPAHEILIGQLRSYASDVLAPMAPEYEEDARFPDEVLRFLGKSGATRLAYPSVPGAPDAAASPHPSMMYFYESIEALSTGWTAVAESLHLQALATHGLAHHGGEDLRAELLEDMLSFQKIGSNCFSEPEAGSDLSSLTTQAVDRGDHFVVNGTKSWVGHAPVADLLNVYCRTGSPGIAGISCLLVDAKTPGITIGTAEPKMGVKALPTAHVRFVDVKVPANRLLGRKNRGMLIAAEVFHKGRLGLAACANGLAEAALNKAASYAKQREQFNRKIIEFQGISFMLADMSTQLAASKALTRHAIAETGSPRAPLLASQAKLFATDMAMKVTTDAVQVLGAYGYTRDNPVERFMREAKLLQIIEGTNQIHRATIASHL